MILELNKVDLNLLKVFLEVYRLNSITLAAQSLDTTQPAVSGILKRLTEQVGQQLFVREGRGITPTNTAVQLAKEIEPLFVGINDAINNLQAFDINHMRMFNVYVTEPMMLLLQPLVDADKNMGGCSINFQLSPSSDEELLDHLSRQQVDLAIDFGHIDHPSYKIELFHSDQIIATCNKNHPVIQGSLSLAQYYKMDHVRLKMRRAGGYAVNNLSKVPLAPRNIMADCDSIMLGLALASQSNILCLSTQSMAKIYAPLFNLQQLALPFATHPLEHYMIWHKRNDKNEAQRWLREKLLSLMSAKK